MTLKDLNKDQKLYLKQDLLTKELIDVEGRTPSYGGLDSADELVTDEKLEEAFESTEFVEEDFG